jgi:hypothetical protein
MPGQSRRKLVLRGEPREGRSWRHGTSWRCIPRFCPRRRLRTRGTLRHGTRRQRTPLCPRLRLGTYETLWRCIPRSCRRVTTRPLTQEQRRGFAWKTTSGSAESDVGRRGGGLMPVGYGWLFVLVLALGFLVLEVLGGLQSRQPGARGGNARPHGTRTHRDDRPVRGRHIATLGATSIPSHSKPVHSIRRRRQ